MTTLLHPVHLPPTVVAAVEAYREALARREAAWSAHSALSDAHGARQREAYLAGRPKPRRSRQFALAERVFDAAEHRVIAAHARVEQEVRLANPGAAERDIMSAARSIA